MASHTAAAYITSKHERARSDVSCRVIILYTNAMFGHGLRSLLARRGGFDVPLVTPKDSDLADAVRTHRPDVIIVEGEGLSPGNARALLEAAWTEPRARVVNIRHDVSSPTLWQAVTVVPQGQESVAEALERALEAHPGGT